MTVKEHSDAIKEHIANTKEQAKNDSAKRGPGIDKVSEHTLKKPDVVKKK